MRLHASYRYCRKITKQTAPSFYAATRLFRHRTGLHIWAICAFYIVTSDIAMSKTLKPAVKTDKLKQMKNTLVTRQFDHSDLLWPAVFSTIDIHGIPIRYFKELLDGKILDVRGGEVRTREELLHYCYQIAGTTSIIGAYALGASKTKGFEAAKNLGIAVQITKILRDVAKDRDLGRIYLPAMDLKAFGVKKSDIERGIVSNEFIDLAKDFKSLALGYYHDGRDGIKYLPRRSQRLIKTAMRLNIGILRRIEENDFNVYNETARLSWLEKAIIILNTK